MESVIALSVIAGLLATSTNSLAVPNPEPSPGNSALVQRAGQQDQFPSKPVSALKVTTVQGAPVDLAAVPGYKVVYFFSVDCPCVRSCEQESFKPLAAQYAGKVSFFAVTSGGWDLRDERSNFNALLVTHHLPFPVLLDPTHAVADTLHGLTASQAVLIDPQNRVIFNGAADDSKDYKDRTGKIGMTKSYLANAIAEALSGKAVSVPYVDPKGCSIAK